MFRLKNMWCENDFSWRYRYNFNFDLRFYLISGKCCFRCCKDSFTTYHWVSNNWYCQSCSGYPRGELYQVFSCISWSNQIVLLIPRMLPVCNISNIAGWFIWLEDVVQHKQLVLQKNYVKFLVTSGSTLIQS